MTTSFRGSSAVNRNRENKCVARSDQVLSLALRGEIVTNNHVVDGMEQIRVVSFTDERTTDAADVVGRDPLTDSALIKLKNTRRIFHPQRSAILTSSSQATESWRAAIRSSSDPKEFKS
jgi:S1-C subfamily serine protease